MPFDEYFRASVVEPLGLAGALHGSPAWGYRGPLDDLLALARELLAPTLVAPETLDEATSVQFPGLAGVLPSFGRMEPNDWGLAFELRDAQVAALDGRAQLAAHVRPLRRGRHVPLGRSRARLRAAACSRTASSATGRSEAWPRFRRLSRPRTAGVGARRTSRGRSSRRRPA